MAEHRYDIERFIVDLTEIPSADPLVDVSGLHGKQAIELPSDFQQGAVFSLDANWNALLKSASENKRESDLQSLCAAIDTMEWEYKGRIVHSPLILLPLDWKINKATQQVELRYDDDQAMLNPFVHYHLIRAYDLVVNDSITENFRLLSKELRDFLSKKLPHVRFHDRLTAGNFHHHRYQIIRELEGIREQSETSRLVASILGNESTETCKELQLHPGLLSSSDADQQAVFRQLITQDLVVQGPPGTGKSQVLTNLLGKCLLRNRMTLVVSEKRVALDVLVKKLSEYQLSAFTFVAHSQSFPRNFIQRLKTTWLELETDWIPVQAPLLLSDQQIAALQLLLDRLNHPTLTAGISFRELEKLEHAISGEKAPFRSDVPDLRTWLDAQAIIDELDRIPDALNSFRFRKYAFATHPSADRLAAQLATDLADVMDAFAIEQFSDLEELLKTSARLQLIDNESFKAYFELYAQPGKRKKFEKACQQFKEITARLALLESEEQLWIRPLSLTETTSWLTALQGKKSWWRRSRVPIGLKKLMRQAAIDPEIALKNWLKLLQLREEDIELRTRFAAWGIDRPEVTLESAAYLLSRLEQESENELNRVIRLDDKTKQLLRERGDRIRQLRDDCLRFLMVESTTQLTDFVQALSSFVARSEDVLQLVKQLPEPVYRILSACSSVEEAHRLVVHSNRELLARQFPELAKYTGVYLKDKLDKLLATEDEECLQFARYIRSQRQRRFMEAIDLLRMPTNRLSPAEKNRKAVLKAGKTILVREFAKTRQHSTIRELLSGPAGSWIEILCPIWLSTPAQVGKLFPMKQELFELVIFDEASQIPITHALGSLQRAERAIVAGDEQQMAPMSYFSGTKTAVDLLHQAGWYWKKTPLKHHYRSEHPALIAFSNKHFYKNELVAYPTAGSVYPLMRHFCDEGTYNDRTNIPEAKAVARFLENIPAGKSLGIIAFSEQQLQCIRQNIHPAVLERLEEESEKGTVFFKALEQVQGDEAELIIVSLGFARNEDRKFHMRFGPLNQSQGFKRLNVLLTRARVQLHFFTSVRSEDFGISSNESVNLLRLFLQQLESQEQDVIQQSTTALLPHGLTGKADQEELTIPFVYTTISDARELATFHRVMHQRGWKIVY